ncbi:MAG: TetR family transcriptional regulator [Acidimicrobiaceae bacterium]|nr:TetR family transcriptional regulator [Acidimicrobiaceae bacterium]
MPRTTDHDLRRRQLTDAVWRIADRQGLVGRGLRAVTIRQVAAEAGVSVGMVQHYFSTKDEMLQFAIDGLQEQVGAEVLRKLAALGSEPDPMEVIRILLLARLPLTRRQRARGQIALSWLVNIGWRPEAQEAVIESQRRFCGALVDQLGAAHRLGRVARSVDTATAAYGLFALSEGLAAGLLSGLHRRPIAVRVLEDHLRLLSQKDLPR